MVCLILTLVIGMSIIISTLRTGISPMPSSAKVRRVMLEQLSVDDNTHAIADLGSGWGHVSIALAKAYPNIQVTGFELSFFPWLVSVIWAKIARLNNITFKRKDFLTVDLLPFQIYCCYLFPKGMQHLANKLKQQTLIQSTQVSHRRQLISNTFALPNYQATRTMTMTDLFRTKIYTYDLYLCFAELSSHSYYDHDRFVSH